MPRAGSPSSKRNEAAEARILDAAWRLYAEYGFEVPLARIARAARVTPAMFRRCFATKKALLDRVFKKLFEGRWKTEWDALLVDRKLPLETRLARFYVEYRGNIERDGARLWTRAGLLGLHKSCNFSATLAKRILVPCCVRARGQRRGDRTRAGAARRDRLSPHAHAPLWHGRARHAQGNRADGRAGLAAGGEGGGAAVERLRDRGMVPMHLLC